VRLIAKYALNGLLTFALVFACTRGSAQDQGSTTGSDQPAATTGSETSSPSTEGAPAGGSALEGTELTPSSMTGDQQSAATKAFCSALAGHYKDAASTGVSALTDPQVLLTAATNYSSVMHVSVGSATGLLKGFAVARARDILSSCAVSSATRGVSSAVPSVGGVTSGIPGTGSLPQMPNTQ
jgi:hypothetical protein